MFLMIIYFLVLISKISLIDICIKRMSGDTSDNCLEIIDRAVPPDLIPLESGHHIPFTAGYFLIKRILFPPSPQESS